MQNSMQTSMLSSEGYPLRKPIQATDSTSEVVGASFPELIDNTARSAWVKCEEYFFRSTVQSIRGRGTNIHLNAGGAFAKGLEVARRAFYEKGLSPGESEALGLAALTSAYGPDDLEPSRNGDKSLAGTIRAFESYLLEYPLVNSPIVPHSFPNGEVAVEFSFATAIPETVHPETGNPILYGGRFDMLGIFNKQLFVVDEKTTTSLGNQWAGQWELDSQFTGYCYGARAYGHPVAGAIIRGVGMLKKSTTFAESIIYRPQWMIDRWLEQLIEEIGDMIRVWKRGRYKKALDKRSCDSYGGCAYKLLCSSPNPEAWLQPNYQVVVWNPLEKHD